MDSQQVPKILQLIHKTISKCPIYHPKINYAFELRKAAMLHSALQAQIQFHSTVLMDVTNNTHTTPIKEANKQKNRRKADQISKQYKCTTCNKKYGSEASLNLHSKIKHSYSESESKTTNCSVIY